MNKYPTKLSAFLFVPVALLLLLNACSEDKVDKNEHVITLFKTLESAIEDKQVDDFMDYLADDITTERGWGKKDIERLIRLRLMRRSSVHIHPQLKDIQWHNDGNTTAQVNIIVAMAATAFNIQDIAKINADLMKFSVKVQLIDGDYVITDATWQPAQPLDFL